MESSLAFFAFEVFYIFVIGIALAILEIQIEGRDGWASSIPTWKPKADGRMQRAAVRITKKEITGYHLSLFSVLLLFFHLPFVWTGEWSVFAELQAIAFFFVFAVTWDYLWFVLNPHYAIKDFNRKTVWWHRSWIAGFPTDYYLGFLIAFLLHVPMMRGEQGIEALWEALILIGGSILLTIITITIYPYVNGHPDYVGNTAPEEDEQL